MKIAALLADCRAFVERGVWETDCRTLPLPRRIGFYAVRLCSLVLSGFKSDQCSLHAASLTFFSLMTLIPILALTLAMARAFGGADLAKAQFDKHLDAWMDQMEQSVEAKVEAEGLVEDAAPDEVAQVFSEQVREIADQLFMQLDQLKFGTLGGIGAVLLLWTVISMLGKVESSLNQVWGVEQPRQLVRKCFDYLGVCLILPFLMTAASSVPVASMVTGFMDKAVGGVVSEAAHSLLGSGLFKLSVTILTGTLTFAFLLGFMPNTRVRMVPALVGGCVTVILFGGWLKLCAMLQIGIAKYSTLYGSFAVLPILLLWVYVSWQIILLGAEISFAVQHRDTYVLEQHAAGASWRARLLMALTLCAETARQAKSDTGGPFAAETFAQKHRIPVRLVKDILDDLVRNRILAEVANRPGEYLLYRCGDSLTVADIAKVILDDGEPIEALGLNNLDDSILAFNAEFDETLTSSFARPLAQM
ncbi:MAG TPA: YihY/virulence factor BrkB family protein [Kiritimatiellia bacterium]|nr:YihY/virulence factor BrkB family protein [Kiritimatiellia bacterium]HRU70504.1 YihY/virulence factor BrkB family protein [Kiritimatiellia bacterium]